MERDLHTTAPRIVGKISTHTLTWSVTSQLAGLDVAKPISTHTLTWSVTKGRKPPHWRFRISTHTLTWSVTQCTVGRVIGDIISTHTLTWSVTDGAPTIYEPYSFQLTRSRGAWHISIAVGQISVHFNSHAHVERDLTHQIKRKYRKYFNSHAHVERDQSRETPQLRYGHFNSHAHVERDTIMAAAVSGVQFQLTRSRGAWLTPLGKT